MAGPAQARPWRGKRHCAVVVGAVALCMAVRPAAPSLTVPTPPAEAGKQNLVGAHQRLPVTFVRNVGQASTGVRYLAQGAGYGLTFSEKGVVLAFERRGRAAALALRFVGARPDATLDVRGRAPGRFTYLTGIGRHARRRQLAGYRELVYRGLWPGIDLGFHGRGGKLAYEFHLRPGARADDIRLATSGIRGISRGSAGSLRMLARLGTLRAPRPVSYQPINGRTVLVDSHFTLQRSASVAGYGFAVGGYDRRRPLVMGSLLNYSTFLGGASDDLGFGIAADRHKQVYVTGTTRSAGFPTTKRAHDRTLQGASRDVFVTKLNAAGTALIYSTYIGGGDNDMAQAIAVDKRGHAYVTGRTHSTDFPATTHALDRTSNGGGDAFVTKLDKRGTTLAYSTFLGAPGSESGEGIAVDRKGRAYVTGDTESGSFPVTQGAHDTALDGIRDAFVTKLSAGGTALAYSTFLGGSGGDGGEGIAVDRHGHAYVTGIYCCTDFPTTAGAYDTTDNDIFTDGFVTKLNERGTALSYSTVLGGATLDQLHAIAVDSEGRAYVTGMTYSRDFPTTPGAFDRSHAANGQPLCPLTPDDPNPPVPFGWRPCWDAFVTKLNKTGTALRYSTFLGGTDHDVGAGIAVDRDGRAYVTGTTASADFPTTLGAYDTTLGGGEDAFVTRLNAAGTAPTHSTYLGGSDASFGAAIATTHDRYVYVTGTTGSSDFAATSGAYDTTFNGQSDVFVTRLRLKE